MTKITTVLFDLDGTLINTNELILASFRETIDHYFPDNKLKREDLIEFIGPTLAQTFGKLAPDKIDEMIEYYRNHNILYHDDMVEIFPSIREGLDLLKNKGMKMGIVSSKKKDMVIRGLKQCGIYDYFSVIVSCDCVKNPKPDPEPIELALELINSSKEETIFVGDNHHDILGGKNAGVITCGVVWSIRGAKYLKEYNPDYIINSAIDIANIIDKLSNKN